MTEPISYEQMCRITQKQYKRDPKVLEGELREIAKPYLNLIRGIYDVAPFHLVYTPGESPINLPTIVYPPGVVSKAEDIRKQMIEAMSRYLKNIGMDSEWLQEL